MSVHASDQFGGVGALFVLLVLFITLVVHIAFALAVLRDANRLSAAGVEPTLVTPAVWALATLLGGVVPAAVYWAIHHSTLRREPPGVVRDRPEL